MRMLFFILSAISLVLIGAHLSSSNSTVQTVLLCWIAAIGVVFIYTIDLSQAKTSLWEYAKECLRNTWFRLNAVQLVFVALPLALLYLERETLLILLVSAIFGTIYSLGIPLGRYYLQLKNIFIIKNLMIGFVWGALILVGSGELDNPIILALFAFSSYQIFIGSSMRDVQDIEKDKEIGINTIPVKLGVASSIRVYYILNLLSLLFAAICQWNQSILILFVAVILWKTINIYALNKNVQSPFWGQYFNIFTSPFTYVLLLILV